MRVRSSGRTTQWGAGEPGPTHGWNTTWPFRSLASNWARASSSARVMVCLLLLVFTIFMLFFSSAECDFEVAPGPQTHENGPTRAFPGRPAASAHQALLGFCGGSGRARQTSRGHAAGVRAGRPAITGGPLGQVLLPGRCFMVWSPPWDWDFGGMGFRQPLLGSPSGHVKNASVRR